MVHNLLYIYVRFSIFSTFYDGLTRHAYYKVSTQPWRRPPCVLFDYLIVNVMVL